MIVGIAKPISAKKINEDCSPAFSLLNSCSLCRNPQAIILKPKIIIMFPRIEPVIDAFTSSSNPALIATTAILFQPRFRMLR
ncbi:MAG: hypothetical protein ACRD9Q_01790 [Nitrososphaeraceae archaeon]